MVPPKILAGPNGRQIVDEKSLMILVGSLGGRCLAELDIEKITEERECRDETISEGVP